jgi:TRAP-type C4-dicarboxylate transport system substrate-binding protein
VFEVNPAAAATTTTLTSSVNPSTSGQAVTFTATVTPSPPNGEAVVFEPLGQSPMTGGVATFTTSTLAVGTTKVRAVYEGDLDFITSMSAWLSQVVDQ